MRVLCVAAHPDDLALSIGGLLTMATGRFSLHCVVVFGRTAWHLPSFTPLCGSISRIRADEERAFTRRIRASLEIFPLPDASLRGFSDTTERGHDANRAAIRKRVQRLLSPVLARWRPFICFAPAAVGTHVDHVATRDAVLALRPHTGAIILYEDVPYAAAALTLVPGLAQGWSQGRVWTDVRIGRALAHKRALLDFYPSQIATAEKTRATAQAQRRGRPPSERLWLPRDARVRGLIAKLPPQASLAIRSAMRKTKNVAPPLQR